MAAVGLWGAYAAFRVLAHGLGETGLDDYFGFGLWITFDLAVIALGAGAFFTGALRYLLNIDALKNIINLTVVVGFLCYSGACWCSFSISASRSAHGSATGIRTSTPC